MCYRCVEYYDKEFEMSIESSRYLFLVIKQ